MTKLEQRILILEDDEATRKMLIRMLSEMGHEGVTFGSGEEALDALQKEGTRFAVYIVDINVPGMGGRAFIEKLKEKEPGAVILVVTGNNRSEDIIETMKRGVYDYIVKPLDLITFEDVLKAALDYSARASAEDEFVANSSEKIRERLEWLSYKESRTRMGDDSGAKAAIYNLKTSLSQGGGFGALLTLIEMIKVSEQRNGTTSTVDSNVLDLLYENAETGRRSVEGLEKLEELIHTEMKIVKMDGRQLLEEMQTFFSDLKEFLDSKSLHISFPTLKRHSRVALNLDFFRIAIRELVVNAIKFSRKGSEIGIFSGITDGYFVIGVKNDVEEGGTGGIPEGKEQLIVEPFYRAHPPVEGFKSVEQFSLGLGLTAVDMILNKHHGLFFIGNAVDHTSAKPGKCVMARMMFPIPDME